MKRIIILLFFIIVSLSFFSLSVKAEANSMYDVVNMSSEDYSITNGNSFNYLFVRENDIEDVCTKIKDFPKDFIIGDIDITFYTMISNDVRIDIKYEIRNNEGIGIYFYINNQEFVVLKDNKKERKLGGIDLREYGESFKFNNVFYYENNIISNDSMNSFIELFKNSIGFNYLSGVTIIEYANDGYAVMKGSEPSTIEVINNCYISDTHISDFGYGGDGIYKKGVKAGNYIIYVYNLTYDGLLQYNVVTMCVLDENSLVCMPVNVSYLDNINKKKYRENYIGGPIKYFDKSKFKVNSVYFTRENTKLIGEYHVEASYNFEGNIIRGFGVINVIDDVKPYFSGNSVIEGKVSELSIRVEDIFKGIKAYDEIDGNLSDRIEIEDIDNYKDNYNVEGEYRFILSVSDNSGNKNEMNVLYRLVDDTKPIVIDEEEEKNEDNEEIKEDPIIDNNEEKEENDIVDNNEEESIVDSNNDVVVDNNSVVSDINENNNEEIVDNEIKDNIEKEENIDNVINPSPIKTNNNRRLSIDDIKNRLFFSGYISEDFNGSIETDYIGNENNIGEYNVVVVDKDKRLDFKIIVEEGVEEKEDNNIGLIASIIGISLVGVIILLVFMLKRKKKAN